mmetsp:Transcript_15300/g.36106  ORF Transcript_15300/g.36106 Transcript_15300/m.36106 type:complete len:88 (-) Transcript_15300:1728-1991(-)
MTAVPSLKNSGCGPAMGQKKEVVVGSADGSGGRSDTLSRLTLPYADFGLIVLRGVGERLEGMTRWVALAGLVTPGRLAVPAESELAT